MNTTIASGGLGGILGSVATALLNYYKVDPAVAYASVAGGVALLTTGAHIVTKYGITGFGKILLHGVPKS